MAPSGHFLEDRVAVRVVIDAEFDGFKSGQEVKFGQCQPIHTVDFDGVFHELGIEPTHASWAARGRAVFRSWRVAFAAQAILEFAENFCGKWTVTDSGSEGFGNAENLVDVLVVDTCTDDHTTDGRVARGHERVRAVIQIKQGGLCALEQDILVFGEPLAQHRTGVTHEWHQDFSDFGHVGVSAIHAGPTDSGGAVWFGFNQTLEAFTQRVWVLEVSGANADATRPVCVGGTNATPGGADEIFFAID